MNDDILIRLLNIAQDIHDADELLDQLSPAVTEEQGIAIVQHMNEPDYCPPKVRDPASDIETIVLDLIGIPADNSSEYEHLGLLNDLDDDDPEGLFCRDWCHNQFYVAGESRRFKQAIARIRKAKLAENW